MVVFSWGLRVALGEKVLGFYNQRRLREQRWLGRCQQWRQVYEYCGFLKASQRVFWLGILGAFWSWATGRHIPAEDIPKKAYDVFYYYYCIFSISFAL
jgi:hypothetical protein